MGLGRDTIKGDDELAEAIARHIKDSDVVEQFVADRPERYETYEDQEPVALTVEVKSVSVDEDGEDATVVYTARVEVRRPIAGQDDRGDELVYVTEVIGGQVAGRITVEVGEVDIDLDNPDYES